MSRAEFCRKYTQVAYTEETIVIGRFYLQKMLLPTGIEIIKQACVPVENNNMFWCVAKALKL